jgi:predicted small lipoprotein YifL
MIYPDDDLEIGGETTEEKPRYGGEAGPLRTSKQVRVIVVLLSITACATMFPVYVIMANY